MERSAYVTIHQMDPNITLMASKQRPRRIAFWGNDGRKYTFLLKGHEDLRQDERVMQLFGSSSALSRDAGLLMMMAAEHPWFAATV